MLWQYATWHRTCHSVDNRGFQFFLSRVHFLEFIWCGGLSPARNIIIHTLNIQWKNIVTIKDSWEPLLQCVTMLKRELERTHWWHFTQETQRPFFVEHWFCINKTLRNWKIWIHTVKTNSKVGTINTCKEEKNSVLLFFPLTISGTAICLKITKA